MNFLKSIRANLKDPKKKSLTLLGIYLIFFIFVFIFINSGTSNSSTNIIEEESVETSGITSYEYIYNINNEKVVEGTIKNNEEIFSYNNLNYYKKDNIVYLDNNIMEIDFDVDNFKYNNIEKVLANSQFIDKTTYNDKTSKSTYKIALSNYFRFINEKNNCDEIDCNIINANITVNEDKYINHIKIDLTEYYNEQYIIEIDYKNINNILEIKKDSL